MQGGECAGGYGLAYGAAVGSGDADFLARHGAADDEVVTVVCDGQCRPCCGADDAVGLGRCEVGPEYKVESGALHVVADIFYAAPFADGGLGAFGQCLRAAVEGAFAAAV